MSAARPLFPRKQTSIRDLAMSHSCQKATFALQQIFLFDHLVGEREQIRWNFHSERLCRLEIDDQLKSSRLQNWQLGGGSALENLASVHAHLTIQISKDRSVADQPTS